MSVQIYFMQNEEDAIQFLDYLSSLNVVIWAGGTLKFPSEVKEDIIIQISSSMCQYTLIPKACVSFGQLSDGRMCETKTGIEFLICCKKNNASRTYEVGRLYYKSDESNPHNALILSLYKKLYAYVRKSYFYSKNSKIYFAPHFKQKYDANYLVPSQLGRPIVF